MLLALACASAGAQHRHGVAALDLAVERGRLTLELHVPMEDLVGFEREPRDARERAAIDEALAFLGSGKAFAPGERASCRPEPARVERRPGDSGHAEIHAAVAYACADTEAGQVDAAALFRRFPRLKRIDARLATARGQSAARLTPSKPTLRW